MKAFNLFFICLIIITYTSTISIARPNSKAINDKVNKMIKDAVEKAIKDPKTKHIRVDPNEDEDKEDKEDKDDKEDKEDKEDKDDAKVPKGHFFVYSNKPMTDLLKDDRMHFYKYRTSGNFLSTETKTDEDTSDYNQCQINESQNVDGPGRCSSSSECQGFRTCSNNNYCTGVSRCPEQMFNRRRQ